ncbi:hypothetical protein GY45DRAFT_323855 [Cubamyces sp. BRFM 1775]|nr:hypothetical protein GY45DRAFT_323855 [Cubamyces sp. BRFM 1775]
MDHTRRGRRHRCVPSELCESCATPSVVIDVLSNSGGGTQMCSSSRTCMLLPLKLEGRTTTKGEARISKCNIVCPDRRSARSSRRYHDDPATAQRANRDRYVWRTNHGTRICKNTNCDEAWNAPDSSNLLTRRRANGRGTPANVRHPPAVSQFCVHVSFFRGSCDR